MGLKQGLSFLKGTASIEIMYESLLAMALKKAYISKKWRIWCGKALYDLRESIQRDLIDHLHDIKSPKEVVGIHLEISSIEKHGTTSNSRKLNEPVKIN